MTKYSFRSALIICLLLFISACGGSATPAANTPSAASTPAIAPTVAPIVTAPPATAVVQPSASAQATGPSPAASATVSGRATSDPTRTITSLSAGLESLKSYRLRMGFSIDTKDSAGNHQTGTLAIVEDIDNEGRSLHVSSQVTGNLNSGYGTSGFLSETYYRDGTTFLVDNGKCRFLSKKPFSGLAGSMILPDDYINSIGDAKLAGRGETLNAVSVDRYNIASATLGRQFKGMVLSSVTVWIATDGYVVRLQGAAVGKDLYGSTAAVVVIYDVDNINQPLGIKAPAGCVAP